MDLKEVLQKTATKPSEIMASPRGRKIAEPTAEAANPTATVPMKAPVVPKKIEGTQPISVSDFPKLTSIPNLRGHAGNNGCLRTNVDGMLEVSVVKARETLNKAFQPIYEVNIRIKNVGQAELNNIEISPSGPKLVPSTIKVASLKPGEEATLTLRYKSLNIGPLKSLDPEWGDNVPVGCDIFFRSDEGEHSRKAVPIDYRFYAGWYFGAERGHQERFIAMSYAKQPGLMEQVEDVRKKAEKEFGKPLDNSPEARLIAAKAISAKLHELGVAYKKDPLYIRGEHAAFAYAQFPIETLYYGGDCEDFSILYDFFLHSLGIPFAIFTTLFHVQPLVELYRGKDPDYSLPVEFKDLVIKKKEGGEVVVYLPVDPTLDAIELNNVEDDNERFSKTVAMAHERMADTLEWMKKHDADYGKWFSSHDCPPKKAGEFGKSWLAEMQFVPMQKRTTNEE